MDRELGYNDKVTAISWALNSAVECHLHTSPLSNTFNNLTGLQGTAKFVIVRASQNKNGGSNGGCEKVRSRTLGRNRPNIVSSRLGTKPRQRSESPNFRSVILIWSSPCVGATASPGAKSFCP